MTGTADRLPPSLTAELSRQYDMVRALGRGGMGVVWLARERSLDRLVAIKVLAGDGIESESIRERFRREARIAARLVHPNIVPLHAFGETSDALYFVMGYVQGETLAARLDREGRVGRQVALRVLGEIADALAFAHREGVVHRDVKPENILLDARSGRAMLADFGVARLDDGAASFTMTGVAIGTPSYMSPEQAAGDREVDGRADIYALGVVGYRMLMGRLPFTAPTLQGLLGQHAVGKPDDLALAVAPPDRGIARVIMRALEKDPAARWARAEDLGDELRSASTEGGLPEELERLQMTGTKALLATGLIGVTFYLASFFSERWFSHPAVGAIVISLLSLFPVATLAAAYPTARTFGWRETLRAMLHPPARWSWWWPRALRRPDDIWDRLPAPVRRARNVVAGVAVWVVSDFLALPLLATAGGPLGELLYSLMRGWVAPLLAIGPKAVAFSWVGFEIRRAGKKLGLGWHDATQLLTLPNVQSDPGWLKPKFARLLAPEAADAPAPRTPDELVRAIAELNDRLRASGLLTDDEGKYAAESVRAAIQALDAEVQRLHGDLDPAEGERLDRRLAGLSGNDDDEELRRLLESQRAVWHRLDQRRQEKQARRDRLRDQLVTLWMQLLELDARAGRGSPVDPELTGQVRVLCGHLSRAGNALTEVDRLLAPAEPRVVTPR